MSNPIDYAPPTRRRFRHWRRWTFGLGTGLCVFAAVAWYQPLTRRMAQLYWLRRCESFARVEGTVVVDDETTDGREDIPHCWKCLTAPDTDQVGHVEGLVFLHERLTPRGERRLVVVQVDAMPVMRLDGPRTLVKARLFTSKGLFGEIAEVEPLDPSGQWVPTNGTTTFYYGATDTNDATHFTFTAVEGGHRITCDGWLTNSDTVKLEPRR